MQCRRGLLFEHGLLKKPITHLNKLLHYLNILVIESGIMATVSRCMEQITIMRKVQSDMA